VLRVQTYSPGDAASAARWDAFVMACPEATFFHLSAWAIVFEQTLNHRTHYLYATRGQQVVGVLPLVQVKTLFFGHSLSSSPYLAYGGVASDDALAAQALEDQALSLAVQLGVDHVELRQRSRSHAEWPRQTHYVTFRKTLESSEEANMLAIPRKQRAMVRKGIKNGLVARFDADTRRFFDLYADGMHRHGSPAMSPRFFAAVKQAFGDACSAMVVETAQGKPISAVLSFYFRDEVLPYYAGDDETARELAGNDFKYWALMADAVQRGVRLFDYGRSKLDTGSYAFKKNWGFEAAPLNYEFRLFKSLAVPQHNPANAKYRRMIATWRRLPRPVVNWLGPRVVKGLG
jgi:FemAB-related protein (PEP-CTERM system-associated)